jgi:bifunctional non-homologous end joining protein LigD
LVLDGELGAIDADRPSFPRLANRILHGHGGIGITYVIFDVLAHAGEATITLPYAERRAILEPLQLEGPNWCTPQAFDDGERLFAAVVQQRLEGIVAKRLSSSYRPGEREWLKVKNRDYWRFGHEVELARSRRRTFV